MLLNNAIVMAAFGLITIDQVLSQLVPEGLATTYRRYQKDNQGDGRYHYGYQTTNGISVHDRGYIRNPLAPKNAQVSVKKGCYSYTSPEKAFISVIYTADDRGYRPTTRITYPKDGVKHLQHRADPCRPSLFGPANPSSDSDFGVGGFIPSSPGSNSDDYDDSGAPGIIGGHNGGNNGGNNNGANNAGNNNGGNNGGPNGGNNNGGNNGGPNSGNNNGGNTGSNNGANNNNGGNNGTVPNIDNSNYCEPQLPPSCSFRLKDGSLVVINYVRNDEGGIKPLVRVYPLGWTEYYTCNVDIPAVEYPTGSVIDSGELNWGWEHPLKHRKVVG